MPTKQDLYQLTKEMLFQKFDGLCAFCGDDLSDRWCIWEIRSSKTIIHFTGEMIEGNDRYENKLPACASCNGVRVAGSRGRHDKMNIEEFRALLEFKFEFLKGDAHYRHALRFGLIKETGAEIVFLFEKYA